MTFHLDLHTGCSDKPSEQDFGSKHAGAIATMLLVLMFSGIVFGFWYTSGTSWEDTGIIIQLRPAFHDGHWWTDATVLTAHHGNISTEEWTTPTAFSLNATVGVIAHPDGRYALVSKQ